MLPFKARHSTVREYAGGSSVGGILRKGSATTSAAAAASSTGSGELRQVDLLVFGYACKVFRDDAKAREIDQGKHLIDWMGDSSLKIDRYDVRGALYELAPHEPPPGGYGNRLDYLTAEEQRAELLCEEERYLFLYNNEEELILQQEEDLKRLKQESNSIDSSYNQVGFQYGCGEARNGSLQQAANREEHSNSPGCEEAEQAFTLPRNFEVPASILLPETMKQHAIIEKTARFIATQGVQMEILLKAKQSNNAQFEFLSQNSLLNSYYKYVVNAIKNGQYPREEPPKEPQLEVPAQETDRAAAIEKPVIAVPTIKYKPSANCAYTQLISKIKGVPMPDIFSANDAKAASTREGTNSPTGGPVNGANFTPVLLQYNGNTFITANEDEESNSRSSTQTPTNIQAEGAQVEILKNSSALALAQNYSSETESEEEEEEEKALVAPKPEVKLNFPLPPESLQNIIDKTATYVIKNGRQFEETLRSKSVERFTFLLPDNEFYPYYMYKITGDPDSASKEQKTRRAAAVAAALLSKKGLTAGAEKNLSPVSFSIKAKDELATTTVGLPQDNSDDEEQAKAVASATTAISNPQIRNVPESVQKAIQLVESQLMARNAQLAAVQPANNRGMGAVNPATGRSRFDVDYLPSANCKPHDKSAKAEAERNAAFEQQQQNRQKELKKAEEKIKDKLAQIAREKLGGLISKEKQLQQERKRKAMAFLTQIKDDVAFSTDRPTSPEKRAKTESHENDSDDSDTSVHSIPITSYGPDEKTDNEEEPSKAPLTPPLPLPPPPPIIHDQYQDKSQAQKMPTVLLSDDDDVQLISETKPHRGNRSALERERYSRYKPSKKHVRHSASSSSSSSSDDDDYERVSSKRTSKSRTPKTSKAKKLTKIHRSSKKKSKKSKSSNHRRSRSPSPSRGARRSYSDSGESDDEQELRSSSKRKRSRHTQEKRRKHAR